MLNDDLVKHGGQLDQLSKYFPDVELPWLDLSTGISPWAYPFSRPHIDLERRLPAHEDFENCETAMAKAFGTQPENVLAVAGIEPVIRLLPYLLKGDLAIQAPTYGDYALSWQLANRHTIEKLTTDAVEGTAEPKVKVVCQPNNPDGEVTQHHDLMNMQHELLAIKGWLVVDEAYLDASNATSSVTDHMPKNLIVLKSFGKFFGLPGLRLGAVIAKADFLTKLKHLLGEWRVSTSTLHIGAQAYLDEAWQLDQKTRLQRATKAHLELIQTLNFNLVGHSDLFFTLGHPRVHELWQHLMTHGIYTRSFEEHNLLRIGLTAHDQDLERLGTALRLYG